MRWQLSDEQVAYQETLRDWLGKVAEASTLRTWLDDGDLDAFDARFTQDGWDGVGVPEDLGGQGGGLVELAITAEELGRAAAPSATWLAGVLAAPVAPDTTWLLPSDRIPHLAPAASEHDGRVSAETGLVLAAGSTSAFVVPVRDGVRRVAREDATIVPRHLLDRSRSVADVTLDEAPGEVVESCDLAEVSARAAVLVAADALGAMSRMLDLAVGYAGQRHQFGVPIGSFQAVKHAAATMLVGIEAARSVVYFAAASVDAPSEARDPQWLLHAAAAKAQVTAEAVRCADTALTLHGAIGYTWEHDLQLFYKRAKLDEPLYGRPSAWNELVADGMDLV